MFPFVRYKVLLRFSIILYFVSLLLLFCFLFCFCFFCGKDDVLFPNAVERNFQSFLTCHLLFSNTARVSMTLKRQSVQSLSGHKAARTFCVSQEGGIVEVMVWSKTKWSFPLVWSRGGTAGEGRGE